MNAIASAPQIVNLSQKYNDWNLSEWCGYVLC